jgi:peptidylprolyl isomerase
MRIAGKVTMVTVALVAAAALSACANSEQDSTGTPNRNSTPPPLPITTTATSTAKPTSTTGNQPVAGECTADDVTVAGDFGAKPTITIPATCKPPSGLLTKDLKAGTGPEVKNGSVVETNYLLQTWSDKKIVDNSFDRGQTLPVEGVGTGQVIKGWDQGLLGLKEGGRRLLIVPPSLGYPNGSGPIKAGETLVFVTDAVKVTG